MLADQPGEKTWVEPPHLGGQKFKAVRADGLDPPGRLIAHQLDQAKLLISDGARRFVFLQADLANLHRSGGAIGQGDFVAGATQQGLGLSR